MKLLKRDNLNIPGHWFRRIVPQSYQTATLQLEGTSPLLMNSADCDRRSPLYRAFQELSRKKNRTVSDDERLMELEWQIRVYLDEELGPYIPGNNIKKCITTAATKYRKGEPLGRGLVTTEYRIPLQYDGPRDAETLWEKGFYYTTMVQNAGYGSGRVMRTRPMFPKWSVTAEIAWDPEECDADTLGLIVERAQRFGLGDYRPEFGAFLATLVINGEKSKKASFEGATKNRNGHKEREQAHEAMKARIMVPEEA